MNETDLRPEMLSPYDPRHTPLPPPAVDVCAGPVFTICVNAEWWGHLSGMISRLLYRDAWAGTEAQIDDAIQSIYKVLNVGRPTMGCGCGCGGDGTLSRYNSDGVYQVSYDGGETWHDAPELDPRNNVVQLPPPTIPGGADPKCVAANSGVAWFKKEQRDNYALLQAGAGIAEIAAAIVAFVVALGLAVVSGGAIFVLLGGINAFLTSLIASEFNEAFTDAVWDEFLCALYCNMGEDLTFTEDQYQAVKSKMLTESNLIVRTWFDKFIYVIGAKGLTNAVRMGALGTMSCDGCCPTCGDDWNDIPGAGIGVLVGRGAGYVDIQAQQVGSNWYATAITSGMDSCCKWDDFEVLSGTITDTNQLWRECGSMTVHTGPIFGDHCVWEMQFDSSVPYTVRMKFLPC